MKTISSNIFRKLAAALVFLTLTAVSAFSVNRVTIDLSGSAEITSMTSDRYVPLSTGSVYLTLEWRNAPMSSSALASLMNGQFSGYGVTATVHSANNMSANVQLTNSSSAGESLEIAFKDYSGVKTVHWLRPEDMMTTGTNWVETRVYTGTGSSDYHTDITYYNGLGLPQMHVSGAASGNGRSIVTPVVYDACMRAESVQPLPFEGSDISLRMVADSESDQAYETLYGADADYAYTATAFDSYSLSRPVSTVMPGTEGRDRSKAFVMEYGISTAEDKVFNLLYDPSDQTVVVPFSPVYLAGLDKTVSRDEDGRTVISFTDALGREVLSRQLDGTDQRSGLDTYTVYDGAGRPVWVISPKGSDLLASASTYETSSTLALEWSTIYRYDSFGRMTERKLPGRGTEYYVYDAGDRLLLYQDGNLRADGNRWIYRVYDRFGREIEKTVVVPVNPSMDVEQIRNLFSDVQYLYPGLSGVADYRIPVSSQTFTFDRSLSSVRYGGQSYRTGFSSSAAVSAFTVPADLSFAVVAGIVLPSDLGVTTAHQKVYEKVWLLGDASAVNAENDYVERAFYHDAFGRVVQTVERDPWGGIARTSVKYDRLGNVLACKESRSLPASGSATSQTVVKMTTCTYDSRGRILSESTQVSGTGAGSGNVSSSVQYFYDELGRLKGVTTGDGVHTEKTYTTQGWLDRLHTTDATSADVFSQELQYCQSGLISGVTSRQGSSSALSFGIAYDLAGRMTDWQQTGTNAFAEKDITYDANGNILTMRRYGADASLESDYSYAYSGNRLTGLTDGYLSTSSFGYDANGNLVSDSRSGITSVTYNALNLPQEMNGGEVKYVYLADGTKLAAVKDGSGLVYCGSMVYSGSFSASSTSVEFESAEFSAGRLVKKSGSVSPEYHVNDYLCSVRVVTDARGEVLERNDYSGYGKRLSSSVTSPAGGVANRYRFSGKEEQGFAGVPWQDFGARMYDADLARWTTPDPLAEKYPGISPYAYCNTNPVNFVDPDGEAWETVWDVANVVYDVGAAVYNHVKKDHDRAREHWKNAAYDGLAAVVPGLPAGFSKLRHVDKAGDAIGAFAKAANAADNAADAAKAAASVSDGKVYVTYTKVNPKTGEVYSGRASGYGTPEEVVTNRDRNHHMNEKGFEKAKLDRFSTNSDAIRGREQQLIELHGGAKSQGGSSGNAINGVSPTNPNRQRYEDARRKEFGQ